MTRGRTDWPFRWLLIAITVPSLVTSSYGVYKWLKASTIGERCRYDGCRTGFCYEPPSVGPPWDYCTRHCDAPSDCPESFECVHVEGMDEAICRPLPTNEFGDWCATNAMCFSRQCTSLRHTDPEDGWFRRAYCIQPCDENNACPPGGKCITSNDPPMCIPAERMKRDAERYYAMQKEYGMENIAHTIARQRREEHEQYLREHPEAREELRESHRKERRLARILMRGMDASLPDAGLPNTDSSSTSATANSPISAPLP